MRSPDFFRPEKERAKTKWRWLAFLLAVIIALTYTFVPRDLEKITNTKNISATDVESISVLAMHEAKFNIPTATTKRLHQYDETFIEYVLSLFEDRKVRKLWSKKTNSELTPDTDTAPVIDVFLNFHDDTYTKITLGYENRMIINGNKRYLLYGDVIDLDELHDQTAALPEIKENDITWGK